MPRVLYCSHTLTLSAHSVSSSFCRLHYKLVALRWKESKLVVASLRSQSDFVSQSTYYCHKQPSIIKKLCSGTPHHQCLVICTMITFTTSKITSSPHILMMKMLSKVTVQRCEWLQSNGTYIHTYMDHSC